MQSDERKKERNLICGRNPVLEAVRSGREIDKLLLAHGVSGGTVTVIVAKCKEKGILVKEVSSRKLDEICGGSHHQGVAVSFAAPLFWVVPPPQENRVIAAKAMSVSCFFIIGNVLWLYNIFDY